MKKREYKKPATQAITIELSRDTASGINVSSISASPTAPALGKEDKGWTDAPTLWE
ncbi:MAG: hypothetical protein LUC86_02010 [Prevotellaceae bacterium]|nr:hypothetical protein [Prevotellaceae bacterium]MCD8284832.1 hypothetical protein [Prevotellaceae bacterium]MCD8303592.1 hypothetical protein [Prevotellaceae bacterium]